MFFSTHPPETLPKVGDTVCMVYGEPLTVLKRGRDKFGTVMLTVQDSHGHEKLTMVEACHWWPQVGDIGTGVPAIYQRWLTCHWEDAKSAADKPRIKKIQNAFYAYENPSSWLYSDFTIDQVHDDMATVSGPKFHGTHTLPLAAIAVLKRPALEAILEREAA